MHASLILVASLSSTYFFTRKRHFDFYTVAFASAIVYFLPGIFGYVIYQPSGIRVPILGETQAVMGTVLLSLLAGALWLDGHFAARPPAVRHRSRHPLDRSRGVAIARIGLAFGMIGFALTAITAGHSLFDPNKSEMVSSLSRWHTLWVNGAIVGLALGDHERLRLTRLTSLGLLLFDVFIGFRSSFAFGMISLLVLRATSFRQDRLINKRWLIAGTLAAGLFLAGYKGVGSAIKHGEWGLVVERIASFDFILESVGASEPFTVQATLNEVIRTGFSTDFSSFQHVLYQFILFAPELGAEARSFNDEFQPVLFGDVTFGLGSNIWAQMFSSGGWLLLIIFAAAYSFSLGAASRLFLRLPKWAQGGLAVLMAPWCFYIHRNDLAYQISLEKRLALVLAGAFVLHQTGRLLLRVASRRTSLPAS